MDVPILVNSIIFSSTAIIYGKKITHTVLYLLN